MEPLRRIVGDAKVVAMGEATHGTREFFQFKHRMFEFLVETMGFTAFAIEANWPESLAVDEYVVDGRGDPAAALAGLRFWTWNTREVLDLIGWMRAYNEEPGHIRKLRFYGFDAQFVSLATEVVANYLQRVDPSYAEREASLLDLLRRIESLGSMADWKKAWARVDPRAAEDLEKHFLENQTLYASRSGPEEWRRAAGHLRILEQGVRLHTAASGEEGALRDRFMAENIRWIAQGEGPSTRMMVWAHNGHVGRVGGMMGAHLARIFGPDYRTLGFAFGEGSFQARDGTLGRNQPGTLKSFSVGLPPAKSLDSVFLAVREPLFVLDLRRPDPPIARFFAGYRGTREIGAFFQGERSMLMPVSLSERYDGIVFVAKTSAARPLPIPDRAAR